ncbi:MAG: ribosome silencing factor [Bacillota bacterium]|nr:ribosome silencing factor [Bacillota bacterium]
MTNKEYALLAANFLDEKLAKDISVIDISERSGFADYFVIATVNSLRQMISLSADLDDKLAEYDLEVKNIEGKGESGWILLDYNDIIINLFTEEARNKYNLEKVWGDCEVIDYKEEK